MAVSYRDYSKSPTMSDAMSAGLWHPNCGHSVNIFIPGITEERDLSWKQDYTEQYKLRQDANYAKRQAKQWDRRAEVAKANGDMVAYKSAKQKAKDYRGKLRDIEQKRTVLDKKQRQERFNRPRGKAFPLDSATKGSQKNGKQTHTTERAKEVQKIKEKVQNQPTDRPTDRRDYVFSMNRVPGWRTDKGTVNLLDAYNSMIDNKTYDKTLSGYEQWWDDHAGKLLDKVTPNKVRKQVDENDDWRTAIRRYTGSAYHDINGVLRKTVDAASLGVNTLTKVVDTIETLDRVFATVGKLNGDTMLYRAMDFTGIFGKNDDMIQKFLKNPEAFKGMTWTDQGYTSSSPDFNGIRNFMNEADAVLHIYADKGTQGIYIADWSEYASESEVLLNRNTTFRMIDVQKGDDGKMHLMVEIVK